MIQKGALLRLYNKDSDELKEKGMKEQNDVILYNRIKQKDKAALELLYDKYERILYSFVYRLTSQSDLAEEVVQEVFIKIWRGNGVYHEEKGKFSSWLFTMARNTAIDLIRKRKSDPIFSDEVFDYIEDEQAKPDEEVEWQEERLRVQEAVSKLSEEQKQIINAVYFKGLTQQKIAEEHEIPLGTVKGRVRLALRKLKTYLSNDLERRADS